MISLQRSFLAFSLSRAPFGPILVGVAVFPPRGALRRSCARTGLRASSCTEEASSRKEDRQDPDQFTGISQSVRTRAGYQWSPLVDDHVRRRESRLFFFRDARGVSGFRLRCQLLSYEKLLRAQRSRFD